MKTFLVVGAACFATSSVMFAVYYARLEGAAEPIYAELASVGLAVFPASGAPKPSAGPTLKVLLAPNETRGEMRVEEEGDRTVITLLARDLFSAGSASPNPVYDDLLESLGDTLNRAPGRVLVVGHTDDQPLQSLRYRNNFELSRERAVSVVRILQRAATDPSRFEWMGAGSTEPRYRPESEPANRSRNRRVEIILVKGS